MINLSELPPIVFQTIAIIGIAVCLLTYQVAKNTQEIRKLKDSNESAKDG